MPDIDLSKFYTPVEAAEVLSRHSGRKIDVSYVRQLAKYGKISKVQVNVRLNVYPKYEVDAYVVEDRGVKSGRASADRAKLK